MPALPHRIQDAININKTSTTKNVDVFSFSQGIDGLNTCALIGLHNIYINKIYLSAKLCVRVPCRQIRDPVDIAARR